MSNTPPAPLPHPPQMAEAAFTQDYYHFIGDDSSADVVSIPYTNQPPQKGSKPHPYMSSCGTLLRVQNGHLTKDATPTPDFASQMASALSHHFSMRLAAKCVGYEVGKYVCLFVWSPSPLPICTNQNYPIPIMMDKSGFHAPKNKHLPQGANDMFHYASSIASKNGRNAAHRTYHTSRLPLPIVSTDPLIHRKERHLHCGGQPCNLVKIQRMGWYTGSSVSGGKIPLWVCGGLAQRNQVNKIPQDSTSNQLDTENQLTATIASTPASPYVHPRIQAMRARVADRLRNQEIPTQSFPSTHNNLPLNKPILL